MTALLLCWLLACSAVAPNDRLTVSDMANPRVTLPYTEQAIDILDPEVSAPWVVTLHGRGSDPTRFQRFFAGVEGPMRIFHLEAPVLEHDGRAWFTFRGKTRETIQSEIRALATLANRTTAEIAESKLVAGRPIVVGFSQGSMVVYEMVMQAPQRFAKAIPVSGVLINPPPADMGPGMTPIIAMHGMADPVIGPSASMDAVQRLERAGVPAELRTFDKAVHWIDGELKAALHAELVAR